jgi:hypothetical protein
MWSSRLRANYAHSSIAVHGDLLNRIAWQSPGDFQRVKDLRNSRVYVIGLTTTGDAIGRACTLRRVIVSAVGSA